MNWILAYYQQICSGAVLVGKWIKLIYIYLVNGIETKQFYYDAKKANHAIDWIESHCFHVEGPLAPAPIKLELWQKALLASLFGIVDENGVRVFREVVLVIARKNGKSVLASCICNYVFRSGVGGYGCRVYNIAPKLEQANIIYGNAWAMITLDPEYIALKESIESARAATHAKVPEEPTLPKRRTSDIYIPATNSTLKKLAFSARKSDGFSPSLCCNDEIASWVGDNGLKQYEVMRSGMGARPDGIMLSCTTSGYVNDGIYDELVKRSTRFLMGDSKETRLLPFLYMIDDADKWNDINELRKSNPNLGVSVSVDYLLEEINIAEGSLSKRAEFITKYACLKQNSSLAWLPAKLVEDASGDALRLEDFADCYAVGGVDLSQTRDLTACCVVIERGGVLYVISHYFLPAEKIDEATARDGVPYQIYIQRGLLTPSGENIIDYRDCVSWFLDLVERYRIYPLKVGYDRYSATYFAQEMTAAGFHMDDVYQGENLHGIMETCKGLLEDRRLKIGDNDITKAHLLNAAVKMSAERGRGKLIKLSPNLHIDGTACLLDALTVRDKYYSEIGEQLQNKV